MFNPMSIINNDVYIYGFCNKAGINNQSWSKVSCSVTGGYNMIYCVILWVQSSLRQMVYAIIDHNYKCAYYVAFCMVSLTLILLMALTLNKPWPAARTREADELSSGPQLIVQQAAAEGLNLKYRRMREKTTAVSPFSGYVSRMVTSRPTKSKLFYCERANIAHIQSTL